MNDANVSTSFAESWKVLYKARTVFALFLLVAMAVNILAFLFVNFAKPIDALTGSQANLAAATQPAESVVTASEADKKSAERWQSILKTVMFVTGILAVVGAVLMLAAALLGMLAIIAGRLPGAGPITAACFYAVGATLWLLLPWNGIFLGFTYYLPAGVPTFAGLGAAYDLALMSGGGFTSAKLALWVVYALYPAIVCMLTALYIGRTGQTNRQIADSKQKSPELAARLSST